MSKLVNFFRKSLQLSINEAYGAIILFSIIAICLISVGLYSSYSGEKEQELAIKNYGNEELPEKIEKFTKYSKNDNKYSKNENYKSKYNLKSFDPNSISESEMVSMGIPKYISKTIKNYRNKGGKFKYKEDLNKIYAMKPELYEVLSPYINLKSKIEGYQKTDFGEYTIAQEKQYNTPKYEKKPVFEIKNFNLNTADTTQLMQVKGIGKVFANRIIKYRDILGGFYNLNQVKETFGLDPAAVEELSKYAFIKNDFKKININKILIGPKHPYLKYNQWKVIIEYRKQHGDFSSISDLEKIKIIDKATIDKIEPYLDFDL